MYSAATLKLFAVLGTTVVVELCVLTVFSSWKPPAAPLHPPVTVLPSSAPVHTQSRVS